MLLRAACLAAGVAIAVGCLTPTRDAGAQATRRGAIYFQVIDTSVNPLAGAEIVLPHLGLAMQLAEEGSLLLVDVPNGMYLVQARHLGYKTEWRLVRVTSDTARAHFMLVPAAHALDTVAVVGDGAPLETRLREFLRRSTSSPSGYFLTREDSLALRRPRPAGATPGGTLGGGGRPGPRGSIGGVGGQLGGAEMIDVSGTVNTSSLFDVNQVPLSTVAGVEVYPTLAGVPPEFRVAGAECGVVLIWMAGR